MGMVNGETADEIPPDEWMIAVRGLVRKVATPGASREQGCVRLSRVIVAAIVAATKECRMSLHHEASSSLREARSGLKVIILPQNNRSTKKSADADAWLTL